MSIQKYLKTIISGNNLSYEESCNLSTKLMETEINPIQVSALLASLKTKGETYEEVSGFAMGLKNNAVKIKPTRTKFYDIVGTGGDGANTFNISTTCAFVLAGAGLNIAKHGNRSISSKCGSADVLHQLGVNIHATPENIENQLNVLGLSFIYAPLAHPSMKNVMQVRKNLGIPTIFNIIGPLANPVELEGQYVGVFSPDLVELMANSMILLGVKNGAVVHGAGGLDEASLAGDNTIAFIKNGKIKIEKINGADYGLANSSIDSIKGGNSTKNAEIVKSILSGDLGPKRDVVLFNSGIALYSFGLADSIKEGIAIAAKSIDSGAAKAKLKELIRLGNIA